MRKLFVGSLLAVLLTGSAALAAERPPIPAKGTEGPDIRVTQGAASTQPVKGIEGPGVR
jgi:hypothetical protein